MRLVKLPIRRAAAMANSRERAASAPPPPDSSCALEPGDQDSPKPDHAAQVEADRDSVQVQPDTCAEALAQCIHDWPRYLTTTAAARYCGFKTSSALRKAKLEGRIAPVGRRGGRGTLMWSRESLDGLFRWPAGC